MSLPVPVGGENGRVSVEGPREDHEVGSKWTGTWRRRINLSGAGSTPAGEDEFFFLLFLFCFPISWFSHLYLSSLRPKQTLFLIRQFTSHVPFGRDPRSEGPLSRAAISLGSLLF